MIITSVFLPAVSVSIVDGKTIIDMDFSDSYWDTVDGDGNIVNHRLADDYSAEHSAQHSEALDEVLGPESLSLPEQLRRLADHIEGQGS